MRTQTEDSARLMETAPRFVTATAKDMAITVNIEREHFRSSSIHRSQLSDHAVTAFDIHLHILRFKDDIV